MAAAEAAAAAPSPGEAKRPEGDEWCDSGLGSLGEGQLGPLPASPGPASPGPALGPVTAAVGAVRLAESPEEEREEVAAAVDPAAWLRHVLGFLTEDGDTALHLAVIHEHEPFLDSILQYTAGTEYLDLQNDLGQTALHIAVILGLSGFVRKLRAAGAGLGLQERGGHTALHLACREGRRGCARHLLGTPPAPRHPEERAQLDSVNYDGEGGAVTPPCTSPSCAKTWSWWSCCSAPAPTSTNRSPAAAAAPCTWRWRRRAPRWRRLCCGRGPTRPPACTWGTPPSTAPATAPTPACPPSCAASGPPTPPPATRTRTTTAPTRARLTTATRNTTTSSSTAGAAWTDGAPAAPPFPPPRLPLFIRGLPLPLAGLWESPCFPPPSPPPPKNPLPPPPPPPTPPPSSRS